MKDQENMKILTNVSLDLIPICKGLANINTGFRDDTHAYLIKKWLGESKKMFKVLKFKNKKVRKVIKQRIGEKWRIYT